MEHLKLSSLRKIFCLIGIVGSIFASTAKADYYHYTVRGGFLYDNGSILFGKNDGPIQEFYVNLVEILEEAYRTEPVASSRYLDLIENGIRSLRLRDSQETCLFLGIFDQMFNQRERKTDISRRFNDRLRALNPASVIERYLYRANRWVLKEILKRTEAIRRFNFAPIVKNCSYQMDQAVQDLDIAVEAYSPYDPKLISEIKKFRNRTSNALSCLFSEASRSSQPVLLGYVEELKQLVEQIKQGDEQ